MLKETESRKIIHVKIDAESVNKSLSQEDMPQTSNPYIIDWCDLLSSAAGGDKLQFIYETERGADLEAIDVRLTLGYPVDCDLAKEQEELNKLSIEKVSPKCVENVARLLCLRQN